MLYIGMYLYLGMSKCFAKIEQCVAACKYFIWLKLGRTHVGHRECISRSLFCHLCVLCFILYTTPPRESRAAQISEV